MPFYYMFLALLVAHRAVQRLDPADQVRHRPGRDPRGRGQGRGDRRQHHPLQDHGVRRVGVLHRRRRRRLRVLPDLPQPGRRVQHPGQRDDRAVRAGRRPRHAVRPGGRRVHRGIGSEVADRVRRRAAAGCCIFGVALVARSCCSCRTGCCRRSRRRGGSRHPVDTEYTDQAGALGAGTAAGARPRAGVRRGGRPGRGGGSLGGQAAARGEGRQRSGSAASSRSTAPT